MAKPAPPEPLRHPGRLHRGRPRSVHGRRGLGAGSQAHRADVVDPDRIRRNESTAPTASAGRVRWSCSARSSPTTNWAGCSTADRRRCTTRSPRCWVSKLLTDAEKWLAAQLKSTKAARDRADDERKRLLAVLADSCRRTSATGRRAAARSGACDLDEVLALATGADDSAFKVVPALRCADPT